MNLRGTLALLVIAAGLGLYVWLVEIRGEEKRAEAEATGRRLVELSAESVTKLELPIDGPTRARVVRDGDGWRLETPVEWQANPATVDSVLDALADFQRKATVESPGADLESYGLGDQAKRVDIWTGEGEPTTLYLGKETPVGSFRYVALETNPTKLYTVAESKTGWLMPTLFNLRDKRVLDVDESDVTGLRVTADGSLVVSAERASSADPSADAAWQLSAPVREPASETRISRLLSDLILARVGEFIDEPESDATYGLDRPDIEIEIVTSARTEHLAFGAAGDDAFLRVAGHATVYQVSERLLESLPRSTFEYRDREVFSLAENLVRRIELEFPRDSRGYAFELVDEKWEAVDDDVRLKPLKLQDLLYAIQPLEAISIEDGKLDLASVGLAKPRVRVTAKDASGTALGWLELGDPAPAEGLSARSSQDPRIFRVANDLGRDVPLGLEAFENIFVDKPESETPAANAPTEDAP